MTFIGNHPTPYECWLTLKNGKKIFIRPMMPTDKYLVIDFFERLSPQTIYMRFLTQLRALPKNILYRFTHFNYPSEFALVGIIKEDGKDAIVAIARYAYIDHYGNTELGVTVRDDWQHLGIGKALVKKVFDVGKENGIFRFMARVHPDNKIMMQIFLELGYELKYSLKCGIFEVDISV